MPDLIDRLDGARAKKESSVERCSWTNPSMCRLLSTYLVRAEKPCVPKAVARVVQDNPRKSL